MDSTDDADQLVDAGADLALEVRTTCTVRVADLTLEVLTYWLDLLAVRDTGRGHLVDLERGNRLTVTWSTTAGYRGRVLTQKGQRED